MMHFVYFAIAFGVVGLACLWGALCVLCIGGWFFQELVRPVKRSELPDDIGMDDTGMDGVPRGLTWRDPTAWLLTFF